MRENRHHYAAWQHPSGMMGHHDMMEKCLKKGTSTPWHPQHKSASPQCTAVSNSNSHLRGTKERKVDKHMRKKNFLPSFHCHLACQFFLNICSLPCHFSVLQRDCANTVVGCVSQRRESNPEIHKPVGLSLVHWANLCHWHPLERRSAAATASTWIREDGV